MKRLSRAERREQAERAAAKLAEAKRMLAKGYVFRTSWGDPFFIPAAQIVASRQAIMDGKKYRYDESKWVKPRT